MATVAQSRSGEEPPSGIQGKGTIDEPYDQGNAPENPTEPEKVPTVTEPASQSDASKPAPSAAPTTGAKTTEERGRDALRAPAKNRIEERDVSPGTLPDGSHAQTSGERGEGYEPGKMNKLKSKLPFGKH